MANIASGLDAAWEFPSKSGLEQWKAAGGVVVSSYLSYDASKDWTPDRIKLVHSLDLGAEMNFEYYAQRALEGHDAGLADGKKARSEIHALYSGVGYKPKSRLMVPASVDFDTTPSEYDAIDAYLKGFQKGLTTEFGAGDYGEYDLVIHTAKAGTSHMEWQTYAWSNGKFAAGVADFYQWRNSQHVGGASVDFDQVINAAKMGAWWPPNHPLNVAPGEDDMTPEQVKKIAQDVAQESVANALHALTTGTDTGHYTHKRFPRIFQGKRMGLHDRFARLEKKTFGAVGTDVFEKGSDK